jgi:hypothetical protein
MSIMHSIRLTINAEFNAETIRQILLQGLANHCIYFESEDYDAKPIGIPALIERVLFEPRDENSVIYTKHYETYFILIISPAEQNTTGVFIGDFMDPLIKQFRNSERCAHIDFARYTRLLLEICKNFSVLTIETMSD